MRTATVRSPWVGTGSRGNPFRPRFQDDYPACSWNMISGNPGDPTCDLAATIPDNETADTLQADTTYTTWNWVVIEG